MIKYLLTVPETIKSKSDNRLIKIKDFRKRDRYSANIIKTTMISEEELLRIDLISDRLYGNSLQIDKIIDVNDIDLFSLSSGDKVNY